MEKKSYEIRETPEYFGPFYPYVVDSEITDIDYNGSQVWLTDSRNGRYEAKDVAISKAFAEEFVMRVANTVSKPFHKQSPILEAETDTLRITIVHESVAVTGCTISIRKSLPSLRMTEENMIAEEYCTGEVLELLKNCVKARMSMVFCGEPGVGKTECAKFFSQYIPANQRVITIEDTPEWHYSKVNPGKDCVELKIGPTMTYTDAIRTCLRLNPKWMMLSEARSVEILKLIEGFSTGVKGMTTIHTDDVMKVVDRMINMAGQARAESRLENDIYAFVDVAVLIKRKEVTKNGRHYQKRYIDQVAFLERTHGENQITMVVKDGQLTDEVLSDNLFLRFQEEGILYPFGTEEFSGEEDQEIFRKNICLTREEHSEDLLIETEEEREEKERTLRQKNMRLILEGITDQLLKTAENERRTYLGQTSFVG